MHVCTNMSSSCSPGSCSKYGVGEVSECTSGFASLYHIDIVEGNTNIRPSGYRESLFPAITFNCTGKITKWIFAANWEGSNQMHTELNIWRRIGSNTYRKVGGTTVRVGGHNITEVYEYTVNPPLAFQEGDILGYFQPVRYISQLDLYLEESERVVSLINQPSDEDEESSEESGQQTGIFYFNDNSPRGNEYPLISVETGINE